MAKFTPILLTRVLIVAGVALLAGCVVPQPAGNGQLFYKREPQTNRGYYLYLPEDYSQGIRSNPNRRWPVVVSFHGMRPFDRASAQAREWQWEADNYGLIVVCPELKTADLLREFPLRRIHPYVRDDEQAILNIMEQVFRTTQADSTRVLATSWSSGGYMAHYMVNHHPNLFTCLAPRQSNFSETILDPATIPYYQDMPIGIFFGENDIPICRSESTEAVKWYKQHNFRFVDGRVVIGLGHERTPQTAAAFFARVSKPPIQPIRPTLAQESLAKLRLVPAEFAGISDLPEPTLSSQGPADELVRSTRTVEPPLSSRTPADELIRNGRSAAEPSRSGQASPGKVPVQPARALAASPYSAPPSRSYGTAGRGQPGRLSPAPAQPVSPNLPNTVRVVSSTRIGLAPLHVSFDVQGSADEMHGAKCSWTDNGEPICTGQNGQRILTAPGDHVIGVLVQTRDHRELQAWTTVKVLPPQVSSR